MESRSSYAIVILGTVLANYNERVNFHYISVWRFYRDDRQIGTNTNIVIFFKKIQSISCQMGLGIHVVQNTYL